MKHLDIKRALTEHGMTQVQLGERMGVSPQSLTFVIKWNPTVKKLEDIAVAIGYDITDLFFDNEDNEQQHAIPADSGISSSTSTDATNVQDAREMMYCPHCGTKFFVVNVPKVE